MCRSVNRNDFGRKFDYSSWMINGSELSAAQREMDAIFDSFFEISDSLRDDVSFILDMPAQDTAVWRRAFIRTVVPLIEGLAYCYLRISHADRELSPEGKEKLNPDRKQSTPDRVKSALLSIFTKLHVSPKPDFSGIGWANAKRLMRSRDALMHPKTPESLNFSESDWNRIYAGAIWILGEFFRLPELLGKKFSDNA